MSRPPFVGRPHHSAPLWRSDVPRGLRGEDLRKRDTLYSAAALRARGWTDGMIRALLGGEDARCANPQYESAAPQRMYLRERVEAAERTAEFTRQRVIADRRSAGSRKGRAMREALVEIADADKRKRKLRTWSAGDLIAAYANGDSGQPGETPLIAARSFAWDLAGKFDRRLSDSARLEQRLRSEATFLAEAAKHIEAIGGPAATIKLREECEQDARLLAEGVEVLCGTRHFVQEPL